MINLLPYDNKKQIRAARQNVVIIKCLVFLMAAIIFLILSCTAASSFIRSASPASSTTSLDNNSADILSQANSAKTDFALAETIFEQKVSYSKIITDLANALPSGVIMDSLSISESSVGGPVQLVFRASSEQKGQEIKDSFNKSEVFLNTSIVSNTPSQDNSTYHYTVTVKTTINKAASI